MDDGPHMPSSFFLSTTFDHEEGREGEVREVARGREEGKREREGSREREGRRRVEGE